MREDGREADRRNEVQGKVDWERNGEKKRGGERR